MVYVSTCAEMYCCVTVYRLSYATAGYCMWEKCTCDHMYHHHSEANWTQMLSGAHMVFAEDIQDVTVGTFPFDTHSLISVMCQADGDKLNF